MTSATYNTNMQTSSEIMCTSISLFHRTEQCARLSTGIHRVVQFSVDAGQTSADNILPSKFNFHKILNHEPRHSSNPWCSKGPPRLLSQMSPVSSVARLVSASENCVSWCGERRSKWSIFYKFCSFLCKVEIKGSIFWLIKLQKV